MAQLYSRDLAFVHDTAFGDFNRRVAPEILRILRKAGVRRGRIVEVGCGSGLLADGLCAAGYEVDGFDISRAMVTLARRRVPRARFRVGDLRRLRIPACAAVICVGEVVSYVPGGMAALGSFFRRVYAALPPHGLFLFDFLHSARRRTYPARTIAGEGWNMTVQATYKPRRRMLTRRIVIVRKVGQRVRRSREVHTVRVYPRAIMVAALKRAGFRVSIAGSIGGYRLLPGDTAVIARR